MATRVCVLDGGGPTDSENTLNSFLTKCGENVFWQIGPDMSVSLNLFFISVSDFTHALSKAHEQHAEDLQNLAEDFRRKSGEFRDRYDTGDEH